jgi:hypothetical protein
MIKPSKLDASLNGLMASLVGLGTVVAQNRFAKNITLINNVLL